MNNIIIFIIIAIILFIIFIFFTNNYNYKSEDLNKDIIKLKDDLDNIKNIILINSENNNSNNHNNNSNNANDNSNNANDNANYNSSDYDKSIIKINNNKNSNNPIVFDPVANFDRAKLLDPLVDPYSRTSADQIPAPQVVAQFNFPTQGILDRFHRVGLLISKNKKNKHHSTKKIIKNHDNLNDLDSDQSNFKFVEKKQRHYISPENDDNSSQKHYRGIQIAENFGNVYENIQEGFDTTNIYNINDNANENDILELIGKKITNNWYQYFTSISIGNKIIKINVNNRNNKELYCGDEVFIPELNTFYRVKIDRMDMINYNPYIL